VSAQSLAPIDQRIASMGATVQHMSEHLIELDADVTRQMLDASSSLTGKTAEAWALAERQLADLWRGRVALIDVFEEIVRERGSRSSVSKAVLGRLTTLLEGESVSVPSPNPTTGHRTLTEAADPTVTHTIDQLVASMSIGYDSVVALVSAVGAVWTETGPRLTALGSQVEQLEAMVVDTGSRRPNDLAAARRALADAEALARNDPLSLPADLVPSITSMIERATLSIRDSAAAREQLLAETADVSTALEDCRQGLYRARSESQFSAAKIVLAESGEELDQADDELGTLRDELQALIQGASPPAGVRRHVAQLQQRADRLREKVEQLEIKAGAGIATRDELRGRLDAYRAKAQAIGLGENTELDRLFHDARDLLYSAPCDVGRAEDLVRAFQRAIRAADEGAT
jgi:hypothetical protein